MKINQLINEHTQRLDEKPMGILSKAGNTIMSKLGSGRASGKLQTGDLANKMHKEYDTYLGQTGEEPSADSILAFLKFKKYPTQNVAAYLASPEAQDQAPAGPGEAPAAAAAPEKTAAPAANAAPTTPEAPAASAEAPAAEPATAAKPAPSFNNQLAGGKQTVTTGGSFNPATMKNEPGAAAPTAEVPNPNGYNSKTGAAIPATAPSKDQRAEIQAGRAAAKAGGPQYGGNFDTQTGEPVDLKAQIKARLGKPDTNFKGYQSAAKAKGIQNASKSFAGKRKLAEAAIGGKVVDKAILIAAQDAAKMGIGANIGAAPASGGAAPASGGAAPAGGGEQGGFMAGLKKGLGGGAAPAAGAAAPTVTYEEVKAMVDKLAVADKQHLLTDLQKEVATAPTESRKRSGTKLAESKQYYSLFKK
jgi:hypothetical protein